MLHKFYNTDGHLMLLRTGASRRDALEDAIQERVSFEFFDLHGTDLSHLNLSGAQLDYADLSGCKVRGSNLFGASLQHSNCRGVDFTDADCRCDFRRARFQNPLFTNARLRGARFERCDFTLARNDFWKLLTELPEGTSYLRAALSKGRLDGRIPAVLSHTLAVGVTWSDPPYIDPTSVLRPCEYFATGIALGDTPANHPLSKLLLDWINKACLSLACVA